MRQNAHTYALTTVAYGRRSIFQRTANAELFITTIFRYRDAAKYLLHAFVVMPEHVHILLTPSPDVAIERVAQLIKGGFSFAIRQEHPGEVWQPGYHAHRVTDAADLCNQLRYIEANPARRHLIDYPHIHTTELYRLRVDGLPQDPSPGG